MTKKQKRVAEKRKKDSAEAICRCYVEKAKAAVRTGHGYLVAAAAELYANPAVQPSRYEVKTVLINALEDCTEVLQKELAAIRKTL